jgi:TIGR03009 family protein
MMTLIVLIDLSAQQPAKPPAPPAATNPALDQLLQRWEAETAGIKTMAAEVSCSRKNTVFNKTEVLTGFAKFMQLPDKTFGVHVHLQNKENPARYEKYVCTGGHIYVFRPEEKAVHIYTVDPKQAGQRPDEGALPFLFGMKAEVAKQRYQMSIEPAANKETGEWYTYVKIVPNFPKDQQDFKYARLTIMRRDWVDKTGKKVLPKDMPREIFWVEPNNIEVKWDIIRIQRDVPGSVDRKDFTKPTVPAGWEVKRADAATPAKATPSSRQPTVIRPQQGP